ncbi:VOC family protein [Gordonia sp. HY285]|uniref:VOC family protein n=1 Tax=Gordonia liuliyuniae TaxID=2911517 RepID=UPI001F467FEC|nr:VOC family protein [Gordonia liuliyuniae]MCF8610546.1 VOC family protein [Gordonia liuliyuniae]
MFILESDTPHRLATDDIDRTAEFWSRALHLTRRPLGGEDDGQRGGKPGGQEIELVDDDDRTRFIIAAPPPPKTPPPKTQPRPARIGIRGWDTQDVTAAVERFVALGASTPSPPYPDRPGYAVVVDPDGNTVEITARNSPDPQ